CIIFFALQQTLANQGAWYLVILGSVAVVVALWYPRGIWGAVRGKFGIELLPVGHWVGDQSRARRSFSPKSSVSRFRVGDILPAFAKPRRQLGEVSRLIALRSPVPGSISSMGDAVRT
ncbi:MAG: hypothetical protein ACRDVC_05185, partial [Acidimicrobiales bacterium]